MPSHPINEKPREKIAAIRTARIKTSRSAISVSGLPAPYAFRLRTDERVQEKHHDAHRNGGVGHIKHIPVMAEGVKVEKIRHGAVKNAIDHVSERPADDQTQPYAQDRALCLDQPPGERNHRDEG